MSGCWFSSGACGACDLSEGDRVNCLKSVLSIERLRSLLNSVSGDEAPKSIGTGSLIRGTECKGERLSSLSGVCGVLEASVMDIMRCCCSLRVVLRRRREFDVDGSIFKKNPSQWDPK